MRPLTKGFIALCVLGVAVRLVQVYVDTSNQHPQEQASPAAVATAKSDAAGPPKPLSPAEQKKAATEQKKAAAEFEAVQEQVRVAYAKTMEDALLGSGYNVDVTAYGPRHKYLKLKWILVSKVTAYQFSHDQSSIWEAMRKASFTKFTITDGYDESWYWNLTN